jgi:tetratricopeptide (TPR) repeat protein
MSLSRRLTFAAAAAVMNLAWVGCGSQPEVPAEVAERVSWVGKKVVAKHVKTKRFLFTPQGELKSAGDLAGYTGVVKAEDQKADVTFALVRVSRDDFWVKAEDLVLFDEANDYFAKILENSPKAYEPRVLRAAMQIESGFPEKSLDDLGEAHRSKPNVSYPLTMRAKAYEMMGEYAKAYEDYNSVLRFDTSNMAVFLGRARTLHALGRTDSALIDLDTAIKAEPGNVAAYLQRARVWEQRNEFDATLLDIQRARKANPTDPNVPAEAGYYWARRGDRERAMAAFDDALKLEPEHVTALSGKALILSDSKWKEPDPKRAVTLAAKACDLSGWKDGAAIDALSLCHAFAGNAAEAGKYAKQALDDAPYARVHGEALKKRVALLQIGLPVAGQD